MAIIDHKAGYKGRLLEQYKCSVNLIGLIDALIEGQGDLEAVLDTLLTQRSIDTAVGAQLDIIGEIIGQKRSLLVLTDAEFFGYAGATGAAIGGYGTLTDGTVGARYISATESKEEVRTLSDSEYRLFIKSKVFKNVRALTVEDMLDALRFILGDTVIVTIEENPASAPHAVKLTINADIPLATGALLSANDALPRPAGVIYTVVWV